MYEQKGVFVASMGCYGQLVKLINGFSRPNCGSAI